MSVFTLDPLEINSVSELEASLLVWLGFAGSGVCVCVYVCVRHL